MLFGFKFETVNLGTNALIYVFAPPPKVINLYYCPQKKRKLVLRCLLFRKVILLSG